ncbi:bystin-like [Condylostylus longicornis]|uniref:bystin-like n=1 Tax=Condylostylus longicornis TaxID=2530218 RepID=UPI00244E5B8D|nr:bystin-like [Condylostylus longicornis]
MKWDPTRGVRPPKALAEADLIDEDHEEEENVIDAAMSAKILKIAEDQQNEFDGIQMEEGAGDPMVDSNGYAMIQSEWADIEVENEEMNQFIRKNGIAASERIEESRTLADLILSKIREKEEKKASAGNVASEVCSISSPKVVEVYTAIGQFLAKYRSGKLPKAFKIIPRLENWEEVLYLTEPTKWTPNAMHEASKIFASNLNPRMAQRFYNLVLLPAVREDISTNKKLNFHYYEALKKALFKPAAWFKGILLPLLLDQCTLREAVIFGSILSKVTIPPLHIAASLIRICNLHHGDPQQWSVSTSYIMCIMLNKKCSLPITAVTACVDHFSSFANHSAELPVVWHRALLTLVQRYKYDFSQQHRSAISAILKVHFHKGIGPEIRQELQHAATAKWTSTDAMHD